MKVGDVVRLKSSSSSYTNYIGCYGIIVKLYIEDDHDFITVRLIKIYPICISIPCSGKIYHDTISQYKSRFIEVS